MPGWQSGSRASGPTSVGNRTWGHNGIDGTDSARLYSKMNEEIAVVCCCCLLCSCSRVKQVQKRRPRTVNRHEQALINSLMRCTTTVGTLLYRFACREIRNSNVWP